MAPLFAPRDALALPIIRSDEVPVSRDEVAQIRARLQRPFDHEILVRNEQRLLFVRAPTEEPDPINDLEACLLELPDWAVADIQDVFLLGARGSFHVPGRAVQPVLERRARLDRAALEHLRATLDPSYGVALHRVIGDLANAVRLGLRIPRARVSDLGEPDLLRLSESLGPLIDSGEAHVAKLAYVLSDEDHIRLPARDLLLDLAPRWEDVKRQREAEAAHALAALSAPAEAAPVPEAPPAAPAKLRRRRPSKVLNVRPVLDITIDADATPDDAAAAEQIQEALTALEGLAKLRNFDVLTNVAHDDLTFQLAAERAAPYPRRLLVKAFTRFGRGDADRMLEAVRKLDADLLVVVACDAADAAIRRTLATKVKVVRPDSVSALHL